MNRTLRGVHARLGSLLALSAMTAVVIAGTVVVLGFARTAGTSWSLVVPLLVLGLLAVPATGAELAAARRDEIGVARLRGLTGPDLLRLVALEPFLAIGAGALVGVGVGVAGTYAATGVWLDEATPPGWSPVLAALVVAGGGVLAVYVGMRRTAVEPLSRQLGAGDRPRGSTVWGVFGALLVLVGAGVTLYRSGVAADDPDGLTLAGPALIGLTAGQVALWTIAGLARGLMRRTSRASMPWYLAARRLRRTADLAAPLRLLVAATVVATLALAGGAAVRDWTDETARLDTLGAGRVTLDASGLTALSLSESLDPGGRHLMAGVSVPDDGSHERRRVFVDTSRYASVVGDSLDDTRAGGLAGAVEEIGADRPGDDRVLLAHGRWLTVAATGMPDADRFSGDAQPQLSVGLDYVDENGYLESLDVAVALREPGGSPPSTRVPVPGCAGGCSVVQARVTGRFYARTASQGYGQQQLDELYFPAGPLIVTELRIGATDLLSQSWVDDADRPASGPAGLTVRRTGENGTVYRPAGAEAPLPVAQTSGLDRPGDPAVSTPGGQTRPADPVADVEALPLLGTVGQLGDLRGALLGDAPTVPAGEVFLVVGEDAPDDLVATLEERTGAAVVSLAEQRDAVARSSGAEQAPVFTLMALCCFAVATVLLWSAAARQRARHRVEVAALRVVGVRHGDIGRAGRIELVLQTAVAALVGLAGGLVATAVLLPNLPILRLTGFALPLQAGWHPLALLVAGALCVLALVVIGGRARAVSAAQTRPARLREVDL